MSRYGLDRSRSAKTLRPSGFTLLEVLIAISITALVGLGSWQLLNSAIKTYQLSQKSLQSLGALQRAQLNLSRDFRQIVPRAIRDEYGDYKPALDAKDNFYSVEFSRIGWRNPLQEPRSELQRVAYELVDGDLLRHHWKVMDRAQDSEPVTRRLLTEVEAFELSFLNESNAWVDEWPSEGTGANAGEALDTMSEYTTLPKAVRVVLSHPAYGEITRIFEQVNYLENIMIQASDPNGDNSGDANNNGTNNDNSNQQNNSGSGNTSDDGFNAGGSVGTGDQTGGGP